MFKNAIIAASLAAIAATAMTSSASAGKRYQGVFPWYLSPGFVDYEKRFDGHGKVHYSGCYKYKRRWKRTGKKYWLRKYRACLYY